jgi:hypothetical protein
LCFLSFLLPTFPLLNTISPARYKWSQDGKRTTCSLPCESWSLCIHGHGVPPLRVQCQLPSLVICPPHFSIASTCHFRTSCPIIRHLVFSHDFAPLRSNILLTTIKHIVCYWIGTSCSAMMVMGSLNQVLLN